MDKSKKRKVSEENRTFNSTTYASFGAAQETVSAWMESKEDTFECELCELTAPYSYYGHKPPNAYSVTLLEDCYVMKDPFTPDKDRFLILGAQCSLCHKRVCVGPDCSLFYSKRFCLPCVKAHITEFPLEIEEDLKKKHSQNLPKKEVLRIWGKARLILLQDILLVGLLE